MVYTKPKLFSLNNMGGCNVGGSAADSDTCTNGGRDDLSCMTGWRD